MLGVDSKERVLQANRAILIEEDRVKAETETAKAPVDFTTLQLHNLLYEKNHYLKAIKACKDFRSKHPDIELVPEEDFFANAPIEIKGDYVSKDNPHDLMLKRLNFELYQVVFFLSPCFIMMIALIRCHCMHLSTRYAL